MTKQNHRILHINTAWDRGGAALAARELIQSLAVRFADNAEIRVAVGDGNNNHRTTVQVNTRFHRLINTSLCRLFGQDGAVWPWNRRLNRLKSEIDSADLIHLHNLHGYYFPLQYLELMRDKPVVWTLHDYWVLTGRCANFCSCLNWKTSCGCPHKEYYPKTIWDRSPMRLKEKQKLISAIKCLTLVPVSNTQASWIEQSYLKETPTKVIYNGIDAPTEQTRCRRDPTRPFTIVYAFSPSRVKGADMALDILAELEPRTFQLKLFGYSLPRSFRYRLTELGVRFEHLGRINDRGRLFSIYRDGDLFMNTSRDESFGRTSIESMLTGTPVIAFDLPVMREILADVGVLVPCFKPILYAQAMSDCIRGTKLPSPTTLQQHAHKFSFSRMLTEYSQIYYDRLGL